MDILSEVNYKIGSPASGEVVEAQNTDGLLDYGVDDGGAGSGSGIQNLIDIGHGDGVSMALTSAYADVTGSVADTTVDLPDAGTYFLFGVQRIDNGSSLQTFDIRLYNDTDSAAVADTVSSQEIGSNEQSAQLITMAPYAISSGPKTIVLQARASSSDATAKDTPSLVGYIKVNSDETL